MIGSEAVLMKLSFVPWNYSRFIPGAYEAGSRTLVKHAINFIEECILSMLTPLRLVPLIDIINRSVFFPVHIQY